MENRMEKKSELKPEMLHEMLTVARSASTHAHAPYSHFHVGAAVLDDQGRIFAGCNVENASLGLTTCAERNAVGAAVCAGATRLRAVVVYTPTENLTPPCGACRQVLCEFGHRMEVHLYNHEGGHAIYALDQLLPAAFMFQPAEKRQGRAGDQAP